MKRLALFLIILLIVIPSGTAWAASRYDREIEKDEVIEDDLFLVENDLKIHEGGELRGDAAVWDGAAEVDGVIDGDVAIFGGNLELGGVVTGDVAVMGGNLILAEGAVIEGECVHFGGETEDHSDEAACTSFGSEVLSAIGPFGRQAPPIPDLPEVEVPEPPSPPRIEPYRPSLAARMGQFFVDVTEVVGRSLLFGLLGLVITAIFPRQLTQIVETIRQKPAASGAVGLLTAIAGPSLLALLVLLVLVTCGLLLPAWLLLALLLIAAALVGWIALGQLLGRRLLRSLGREVWSPPMTAALGTAALTLVLGSLGLPPFVWGEGLITFLLLCVGLGAAALTQLGTKAYPPGAPRSGTNSKVESVLNTMPPNTKNAG